MSITWAAPLALAALAAVLVPIAIHLLRRAEHRTTPFAALRYLRATGLPRRRLRIAEPALLALRCALVAAAALLLAQPLLERPGARARHVVAIVPPATTAAARTRIAFSGTTEARWLAPGFPPASEAVPSGTQPTASLLRELDYSLPAGSRLDVVLPEIVAGLDAERPRLSRAIGWHVVPALVSRAAEPAAPRRRRLVLDMAPDSPARGHLAAAVAGWRARGDEAELVEHAPSQALPLDATLVRLGAPLDGNLRRWVETGGTALVAPDPDPVGRVIARRADGTPLVRERRAGRGRIVALSVPFEPAALPALLDADFPERLARWIDGDSPAPDVARADASRPGRGGIAPKPPAEPLARVLALLVAALFAIERAWASGLRRRRLA